MCFRKPISSKKPAKGKFKNASSHKKSYLPKKASKSYLPTKSSKVYGILVILGVELFVVADLLLTSNSEAYLQNCG